MEKGDTETNGSKDPQAGNSEDVEGRKEEGHVARDKEEDGRGTVIVDAASDLGNKAVDIRRSVDTRKDLRVVTAGQPGVPGGSASLYYQ